METTGKFLVLDGVRFAQVLDESEHASCDQCAMHKGGVCTIDWREEQSQGLNCMADSVHYEVVV